VTCCCHCEIGDEQFGAKMARRDVARYQKKGPDATTRELIEVLSEGAAPGSTLIDVGSGIGALSQALLDGPVSHATLVDESSSYQAAARDLARERGTADRCTFVGDDFVHAQPGLGRADVVTLDRVVCCYPDYEGLLGAAAETGASLCGFSHPRDRWYIKPVIALINLTRWIVRSEFRVFVHSEPKMMAFLSAREFRVLSEGGTFVWKVTVMERSRPSATSEESD
jgi:magnesium-protoporphyrin O-methyltransferase